MLIVPRLREPDLMNCESKVSQCSSFNKELTYVTKVVDVPEIEISKVKSCPGIGKGTNLYDFISQGCMW